MLRVKLPAGAHARAAARDRRALEPLRPRRRRALDAAERSSSTGSSSRRSPTCSRPRRRRAHDRGRLRRHRPQHHRLPRRRASPTTSSSTRRRSSTRRPTFFYGNPDYSDLPRKHKYSIAACADRCNAPEINCISLVGVDRTTAARASPSSSAAGSPPCRGSRATWASSSRAGRGDRDPRARSSTPGRKTSATASRASRRGSSSWSTTSAPEGMRERVEARSGGRARGLRAAADSPRAVDHLGVHAAEAGGPSTSASRCTSGSSPATR